MSEGKPKSIEQVALEFAAAAKGYCDWLEKISCSTIDELHQARRLLSELQVLAIDFPEFNISDDSSEEENSWDDLETHFSDMSRKAERDYKESKPLYDRLQSLPLNRYWFVFNPLEEPPGEALAGSLADDLADIYMDLKRGLAEYDEGRHEDAVWSWHFFYLSHWGKHLTGALRALHWYLSENEMDSW